MHFSIIAAAAGLLFVVPASLAAQSSPEKEQPAPSSQDAEPAAEHAPEHKSGKPAKQPAAAPKAEPEKVCKRIPILGSLRSEKVCMTKEQWEAERRKL